MLPQKDGLIHLYCLEKWSSQHALVENPDPQSFLNPLVSQPNTQKQMFSRHSADSSHQIWLQIRIVILIRLQVFFRKKTREITFLLVQRLQTQT